MRLTNKILSTQVKKTVSDMTRKFGFMGKLPSEQDLAVQLGVSRNTVRKTLKGLEDGGLVISCHGIDALVTRYNGSGNIRYSISALDNTAKIISEHGYVPGTQSVFVDVRMIGLEISKRLGSNTPVKILRIERVRTADDTPIIFVEDYIPYVGGMLEGFSSHAISSLFQFINRYAPVSFTNCSVRVVLNSRCRTDKLSLTDPGALLLLRQIHYSPRGNSIFYFNSYFIIEKLEFNLVRWCTEQVQMRDPD